VIGDVAGGLTSLLGGAWLLALGFTALAVSTLGPRDDLAARPGRRCP
jgi:hypothetical protein